MDSIRPSSSDCWMICKGQPAFVETLNIPNQNTWYAAEGTAAHHLGAVCLETGADAEHYEGYNIAVSQKTGDVITWGDPYGGDGYAISEAVGDEPHWLFEVDPEMSANVQEYIDYVRRESYGHDLLIEQSVNVSKVLSIRGRQGTADAIILPSDDSPLTFVDLKYGQGVPVYAENNRQLRIYAAGYVNEFADLLGPWNEVRIVIHQPRLHGPSEWVVPIKDLKAFAKGARAASKECQSIGADYEDYLLPGTKQCQFCDAKGYCPKLAEMAEEVLDQDLDLITGDVTPFPDLEVLAERRKLVELLEPWCKAVRDAAQREIEAGNQVPDWKPVRGRRGPRAWADEKKAERQIKKFRLRKDQMYSYKLISPSQLEKVTTKERIAKLQDMGLIEQSEGRITIVPEDDPRDVIDINPMFDNLDETQGD